MPHKSRPFLIAGNWKMNLSSAEAVSLSTQICENLKKNDYPNIDIMLAPAFVHLHGVGATNAGGQFILAGQDCSALDNGAHTGDISAVMLKDMGCDSVILGHSERRSDHAEASTLIQTKAEKAISEGLNVVICVGETLEEREAGKEKDIIQEQLINSIPNNATGENCVIAYEPVWAIGTGKTASPADVEEMHSFICEFLSTRIAKSAQMRIIYGGSVKPENARELMLLDNVAGALIGGASLKADSFLAIAKAAADI